MCPPYANKETSDKGLTLAKDIVSNTHSLNLEVKEEDAEKLLEINYRELTITS